MLGYKGILLNSDSSFRARAKTVNECELSGNTDHKMRHISVMHLIFLDFTTSSMVYFLSEGKDWKKERKYVSNIHTST